jgi:hypothetical protein
MEKDTKTSTDPQENEMDSNYLGKFFRKLADDEDSVKEREEYNATKTAEDKTLDEQQDPANK